MSVGTNVASKAVLMHRGALLKRAFETASFEPVYTTTLRTAINLGFASNVSQCMKPFWSHTISTLSLIRSETFANI